MTLREEFPKAVTVAAGAQNLGPLSYRRRRSGPGVDMSETHPDSLQTTTRGELVTIGVGPSGVGSWVIRRNRPGNTPS